MSDQNALADRIVGQLSIPHTTGEPRAYAPFVVIVLVVEIAPVAVGDPGQQMRRVLIPGRISVGVENAHQVVLVVILITYQGTPGVLSFTGLRVDLDKARSQIIVKEDLPAECVDHRSKPIFGVVAVLNDISIVIVPRGTLDHVRQLFSTREAVGIAAAIRDENSLADSLYHESSVVGCPALADPRQR